MKLIIAENGNNAWLAHGTPHLNVRTDFMNMETTISIRRKQTFGVLEESIYNSAAPGGLSNRRSSVYTTQFMYFYDL
jgi:hypothetical protein